MSCIGNGRGARPASFAGLIMVGLLACQVGFPTSAATRTQGAGAYHLVAAGETLYGIARSYGTAVEALMAANGLDNPHHIEAGQRLVIFARAHPRQPPRHGSRYTEWAPPPHRWRSQPPVLGPDFGRMLDVPIAPHKALRSALIALGTRMVEPPHAGPEFDSEVPAGYTFLGQFIDHDITLAVGGELDGADDQKPLQNLRTAALDLDSLYGEGPRLSPYLYDLPYLREGRAVYQDAHNERRDLPRVRDRGAALIGDPRNDENFVIAQLHAAFIAFHNRITDTLIIRHFARTHDDRCRHRCSPQALAVRFSRRDKTKLFEEARRHVIHYYHRLIIEDYLPRLIGPRRTEEILREGRAFYMQRARTKPHLEQPYIPIEFAAAAFRYGHSQVRKSYVVRRGRRVDLSGDLARRGMSVGARALLIDWRYFFDLEAVAPKGFNHARLLDPLIVQPLHRLPDFSDARDPRLASLPVRNLLRGAQLCLPSGQAAANIILAHHLGRKGRPVLPPGSDDLLGATLGDVPTPFFYYILQEAAKFGRPTGFGYGRGYRVFSHAGSRHVRPAAYQRHRRASTGHTLGPVGGTVVGEVLIGLLEHYRLTTGEGLAYRPAVRARLRPRQRQLSLSPTVSAEGSLGARFLMRDFLIGAGVAAPLR